MQVNSLTRFEGSSSTAFTVAVYVDLDLLGDALIKLPVARALRQIYPKAKIVWIAGRGKSAFATTLAPITSGLIDEVLEFEKFGDFFRSRHRLKKIDLLIDTQSHVLTTIALRALRPRKFVSKAARFLFSDVRPPMGTDRPDRLVDRLLHMVQLATNQKPVTIGALHISASVRDEAIRLLPPLDGQKYVMLVPGAGGRHKVWPLENHIELAKTLVQSRLKPVITLGPDEHDFYSALAEALPEAIFPLQNTSISSVDLTIALAGRCAAGVAADCGGGHLLAAAGIPLVSLFGPTDPGKLAPTTPHLKILRAQNWGRSDMSAIPVAAVQETLFELLKLEEPNK